MQKVENLQHYNSLIKEQKTIHKKLKSNSFLMPDEVNTYIANGTMYFSLLSSGILFLCDENDYYHIYFYCNTEIMPEISPDKPWIIDFVFRGEEPAKITALKDYWCRAGFSRYKRYIRMKWENAPDTNRMLVENYQIRLATDSDIPQIQTIWRDSLDIFSTPLPTVKQMQKAIQAENIYCIADEKNQICAALELVIKNKICQIEHVVVASSHRRMGLAEILLTFVYFESGKKESATKQLWVDEQNTAAIGLYRKCGFLEDGIKSDQILFNKSQPAKAGIN